MKSDFYVYVYIDPRNMQEFYYGKGHGDRKFALNREKGDSEKNRIVQEIKNSGEEPIIKVIARGLTEDQALLVESALIWKLGKNLVNTSSGAFSKNFRPDNCLHKDLYGFDYETGVYAINIDERSNRSWNDSKQFGFVSAGQNWKKWGSKICKLRSNDIVCAYLAPFGYVGVGRVLYQAVTPNEFIYNGKHLSHQQLESPWILEAKENSKDGEFLLKVEWLSIRDRNDRVGGTNEHWRPIAIMGSMENQRKTCDLIEKEFRVSLSQLLLTCNKAG